MNRVEVSAQAPARSLIPARLAGLISVVVLGAAIVLPAPAAARSAAGVCRARCAQGAKACLRGLRSGRTACAQADRTARKECRAQRRAVATAGQRSCRGYRVRCQTCCRTGRADCAATPDGVVATVGPEGGTLEVRGFEGGALRFEIPAGALGQPTEIRLEPLAADAGSMARFRVLPAGLAFAARATLRYVAAGALPARSVLRWRVGDARFPLPTTRQGDELRAETVSLGYVFGPPATPAATPRSGAGRPQAADQPATEIDVAPLECEFELAALRLQLAAAVRENDIARAQAQFDRMLAVVEACALREQAEITARACDAYQAAALTAQAVAADSYQRFRDLVTPLLLTQAGVQITGATCTAPSLDALMESKLGQFIDFIEADYARPDFAADFETAVRELRRLVDYDVACQLMGLFPTCARFDGSLIPTVLDRMRSAAFHECHDGSGGLLLSQMYTQEVLPRRLAQPERSARAQRAAASGSYLTYGRFTYADLERDMAYCRSVAEVRVFEDARGVPAELEDRRVVLPASTQPGSHTATAEVEAPRDGSLSVGGPIGTLTCPDGSVSADEVVARVNGVRLAGRPASGPVFATATSPFDLIVEDVLAQAVPNGALAPEFTLELHREGSGCGGLFSARYLLYAIRVRIAEAGTRWFAGTITQERRDLRPERSDVQRLTWTIRVSTGVPEDLRGEDVSGTVDYLDRYEFWGTDLQDGSTPCREAMVTLSGQMAVVSYDGYEDGDPATGEFAAAGMVSGTRVDYAGCSRHPGTEAVAPFTMDVRLASVNWGDRPGVERDDAGRLTALNWDVLRTEPGVRSDSVSGRLALEP